MSQTTLLRIQALKICFLQLSDTPWDSTSLGSCKLESNVYSMRISGWMPWLGYKPSICWIHGVEIIDFQDKLVPASLL
jgi:hypothetical protein